MPNEVLKFILNKNSINIGTNGTQVPRNNDNIDNDNSEMINPTVTEETRADTKLNINNSRGELNQFLHRKVIQLNEDPLQVEWENNKVIGTSEPSERLFSKAGETVNFLILNLSNNN
ncbi:zinc finger BED domain-containing protein 4-like, partial [Aphis craccivora]